MAIALTLKDQETNVIEEPGSYTYVVAAAGPVFASVQASVLPSSSLIITIAQSGSASVSVSSPAIGSAQNHIELQKLFNCAAADVITVTVADTDLMNTNKLIIKVNPGLC